MLTIPNLDKLNQYVKDNPVALSIGTLSEIDDFGYALDAIEANLTIVGDNNYTCGCLLNRNTGRIIVVYDWGVHAPESDNAYFETLLRPYIISPMPRCRGR